MRPLCDLIILIAVSALFAIILVEWVVGCGETYTDAAGVRHQNECAFIPQPRSKP